MVIWTQTCVRYNVESKKRLMSQSQTSWINVHFSSFGPILYGKPSSLFTCFIYADRQPEHGADNTSKLTLSTVYGINNMSKLTRSTMYGADNTSKLTRSDRIWNQQYKQIHTVNCVWNQQYEQTHTSNAILLWENTVLLSFSDNYIAQRIVISSEISFTQKVSLVVVAINSKHSSKVKSPSLGTNFEIPSAKNVNFYSTSAKWNSVQSE